MRAVLITRQAPKGPVAPNVEYVEDWADSGQPGPGELRVRALATALNHMDLWTGMGIPGVEISYPHIGGVDGCGLVESVGAGVDKSWIGRRVVHNAAVEIRGPARPGDPDAAELAPEYWLIGEHSHGTHREFWRVPAANAVDVGDADPRQAAAIGLTALTAWSMMVTKGDLRPGQYVLITGIGGGVATAALAIARWRGCRIAVSSRSEAKLAGARELGAEFTIVDEGQDWSRELRAWTNKRGVDMVVDTIGGHVLKPALRALARGGAFITAGTTAGPKAELELNRVFWNQLRVLGSTMGTNEEFREVMALFRAGEIVPEIDCVLPADRAREAWARLEAQEQMGKIVLDWS
jgi:NADPH:quinone reductase-like Zn-dependent oxidoreductase